MEANMFVEGDEDNLVTWDASPDDPDEVVNYTVYRSEEEDGDYENAGSVEADGSADYNFTDENRGTADEILWWYIVRAEDDDGHESEDAGPAREPGPLAPTDPRPEHGATGVGPEEVDLSVYVEHSEGNTTDNVTFYDASADTVIGSVDNVENGTRTANVTWDDLEEDETYQWYVEAEDAGGIVQSETWEFTTDDIEISEVVISPEEDQVVDAGEELEFDAEALDEDGNVIENDSTEFDWQNATDGEFYETNTGDYDVTATYEGVTSEPTTVTVEPTEAEEIEISPQNAEKEAGGSQEYTATAIDEWGNEFEVTDDTNWSDDVDPADSSFWTDNVITVEEAGDWTVTGEYENESGGLLTDTGSLTVEPAEVDYVEIDPAEDQIITAGETIEFGAKAYDQYDNLVEDDDTEFTWQNTDDTGLFDETEAGEYDVTATYDEVTSTITTVTVESAEVDYVEIDPEDDRNVGAGEELEFDAWAYDEYDNLITDNVTEFTWENATDGFFCEEEPDDYNVTATYDEVSSPVTTITVLDVDHVVISPEENQTVDAGEELSFTAEAFDEEGKLITDNVTEFTWENISYEVSEDNVSIFYEEQTGEFNVTATYGGVMSNITVVTVEPADLDYVVIYPEEDQVITAGETIDFDAEAYDEYDNLIDDEDTNFTWQNTDETGLFDETEAGDYDVTATSDTVTSPITVVTVEPAEVDYVEINPAEDQTVTAGEELEFTAFAYDEWDNLITDDVAEFTWENIFELDEENNVAIFYQEETGNYDVAATYEDESMATSPTTRATVDPSNPDDIEIIDYPEVLTAGESFQITIEAYDEFDNIAAGRELEDFSIISDHDDEVYFEGVVVFGDEGQYNAEVDEGEVVTAAKHSITASSNPSDTVEITVEPGPVDSVVIYPAEDQTVEAGEEKEFTAKAHDEFDNLITDDVTEFEWENIEDVDEGVAIFYEEETGKYYVNATYEDTSDMISITVEPGDPSDIGVIDRPEEITAGESFEITLNVSDEMGNLITDTELNEFAVESEHDGEVHFEETVNLNSNGQYVAVISEDQVVSAGDDHTITLSFNPSKSFQITVEPGETDNVEIKPSEDKEIEVGEELEFTAEVYDEYGNLITDDVGDFEWENIDEIDEEENVAIFYNDEPGEYQIRAEYEGVTSALVTVALEEVTEGPTTVMTELCSLWWLWLVAIMVILLIGGFHWRKRKKDVDEKDTSVKTVRRELKKAKKEPEEELSEEPVEEREAIEEEPTEEQVEEQTEMFDEEAGEEVGEESMEEQAEEPKEELSKSEAVEEFQKVKGIGPTTAENLYEENFETLEQLKEASVEELTEVKGIGEATAEKIHENLKE